MQNRGVIKHSIRWIALLSAIALLMSGCTTTSGDTAKQDEYYTTDEVVSEQVSDEPDTETADIESEETEQSESEDTAELMDEFSIDVVPEYADSPYVVINNNIPFFTEEEITSVSYESYSNLDALGRCGVATACIGQDIMPTEERGSIGSVKPTGWHSVKYDMVSGNYLYNRCHLIAYELAGENANEKNLITGTRYFNVTGMLPFENMVADYVKETGNHVMYRVTPIFEGDNLVASGVLMEALSVEDDGEDIQFCVYCYNVQPGIIIDYATGDSKESDAEEASDAEETSLAVEDETSTDDNAADSIQYTYILNTNTKKFHYSSCSSVKKMSDSNKKEYTGVRDDLIAQGYSPCGNCNP